MTEGLRAQHAEKSNVSGPMVAQGPVFAPHVFRLRQTPRLLFLLVVAMAAVWLALMHHLERKRFANAFSSCHWSGWEPWDSAGLGARPHRVAIVADPQIIDDYTYPGLPRLLQLVFRKFTDNYLHQSYRYLQSVLDPDTTVFLGDLFDGGRDWDNATWTAEYDRFNRIFPLRTDRATFRGLPGNHDIGLQNISVATRARFAEHFGASNDCYVLGNHSFLQLDTISYMHDDPAVHTEARTFVETVQSTLDPNFPRIVLTHVPFHRNSVLEPCGPGRESTKPFPLMYGYQYQTIIDFWASDKILRELNPVLVLSGDDHDYCDMTHLDYEDPTRNLAREISCKSVSMTSGIKYPAYQLLSLHNPQDAVSPNSGKTYETRMCSLPTPYVNFKTYAFAYVLTCAVWWYVHFHQKRGRKASATFLFHCAVILVFVVSLLLSYN